MLEKKVVLTLLLAAIIAGVVIFKRIFSRSGDKQCDALLCESASHYSLKACTERLTAHQIAFRTERSKKLLLADLWVMHIQPSTRGVVKIFVKTQDLNRAKACIRDLLTDEKEKDTRT